MANLWHIWRLIKHVPLTRHLERVMIFTTMSSYSREAGPARALSDLYIWRLSPSFTILAASNNKARHHTCAKVLGRRLKNKNGRRHGRHRGDLFTWRSGLNMCPKCYWNLKRKRNKVIIHITNVFRRTINDENWRFFLWRWDWEFKWFT